MTTLLFFPHMAKTTENLPNRIREWRQRRERTLADLAKQVGTTPTQLQRMEVGTRPVLDKWLERIARALDVTEGELLAKSHNPWLVEGRERELIELIRSGDEQLLRTIEAVADAHRSFTPAPGEPPNRDGTRAA